MYVIARSKNTDKARLSHFSDKASDGIKSSANGTDEVSSSEEDIDEEEEAEEIGTYPIIWFKQEELTVALFERAIHGLKTYIESQ